MTVTAAAAVAVAVLAGPAAAHVEVSADKAQAGATDVTVTFTGEAENPSAGIRSERVVLPEGIAPADVTAGRLPSGWTFTRASDGFTVGGRALRTGTDAVWSVRIAKLPDDQTRLSFKTLETYGNGDVSRWIEIQEPGQDEPDNPAPLLTLKPAAGNPAGTAAAVQSAATAAGPATARAPDPVADTGGSSTWWIWLVAVALVVAGGVLFLLRRRGGAGTG